MGIHGSAEKKYCGSERTEKVISLEKRAKAYSDAFHRATDESEKLFESKIEEFLILVI